MKKELKDYLHMYLGCECRLDDKETGKLIGFDSRLHDADIEMVCYTIWLDKENDWSVYNDDKNFGRIKPILRPLSDMTGEEAVQLIEIGTTVYNFIGIRKVDSYEVMYDGGYPTSKRTWLYHLRFSELKAEQFNFLISKHFDLFDLIEAGLAIDKTTLK